MGLVRFVILCHIWERQPTRNYAKRHVFACVGRVKFLLHHERLVAELAIWGAQLQHGPSKLSLQKIVAFH